VNWCFDCGSALAEAEIEYQDKTSPAIDVMFRAVDSGALFAAFGVEPVDGETGIPIWTTTPWTLPANEAVALHAELDYVLVNGLAHGEPVNLVLAAELEDTVSARLGLENVRELGRAKGTVLEHLRLHHPFYSREVPVILGDHVTTEAGTGAVHTAPGHGEEDFQVGRLYDLPVTSPEILKVMHTNGTLLFNEDYEHSYPHCWRHKTPTAYRVTPQWFFSMDQAGLQEKAIEAIKNVRWVPEWGAERIRGMVASRPDWCISRQRTWGVPITLFVDRQTDELHPDSTSLMHKVANLIEEHGVDCWYTDEIYQQLGVDETKYQRLNDILDVWFDSGVSHRCVLDEREELERPAQLYLEGSDQHRGWFQSSLLTSVLPCTALLLTSRC